MAKSTVFAVLVEKSGYVKSFDGDLIFTPHVIDAQAFTDFYDARDVAEKYGGSVDEAETVDVSTCGEMDAVEMIAARIAGHSGPYSVVQIVDASRLWNETLAAATGPDIRAETERATASLASAAYALYIAENAYEEAERKIDSAVNSSEFDDVDTERESARKAMIIARRSLREETERAAIARRNEECQSNNATPSV